MLVLFSAFEIANHFEIYLFFLVICGVYGPSKKFHIQFHIVYRNYVKIYNLFRVIDQHLSDMGIKNGEQSAKNGTSTKISDEIIISNKKKDSRK